MRPLLLFLFLNFSVYSFQFYDEYAINKPYQIGFQTLTDFDDLLIGLTFEMPISESFSLRMLGTVRPYEKKILVPVRDNFLVRYLETRFILGASIVYAIEIGGKKTIFLNGGISYSIGNYNGTSIDSEDYFSPMFGSDLHLFSIGDVSFLAGYRHIIVTENQNRLINFTITYGF